MEMIGTKELGINYKKGLEFYDQGLLTEALETFQAALNDLSPATRLRQQQSPSATESGRV